jgi:hypothetical protein
MMTIGARPLHLGDPTATASNTVGPLHKECGPAGLHWRNGCFQSLAFA